VSLLRAAIDELRVARPDLVEPFSAALAGAQATVLGRLWGAFAREPLPGIAQRARAADTLVITLDNGDVLTAPAAYAEPFSQVPPGFTVVGPDGPIDRPTQLLAALGLTIPSAQRLAAELDNSVANLALARAATGGMERGVNDSTDAEQAVVDGHPQHPCCRTRTGLSVAEVLAYAPEHRPVVNLALLAVPADRWEGTGAWPDMLRDGETVLVPVHPWQRDHVLSRHPGLSVTDKTIPARPLLSLRTLAPVDVLQGYHIKTALDVQVTNYRRTISAAEIADGPILSDLVSAVVGKAGYGDTLRVLRELGGGSVRVDGQPSSSLAAMMRESSERHLDSGEIAVPLTAIYATEATLVSGDPVRWLAAFAELVMPPALTLLSMGIALEAHGQNTLVVLREGRPVRVLYRDLDGVRVSPNRLAACGFELPPLAGSRAGDDVEALRTKLFGGLLSGVFSELVAVLARARQAEPEALWVEVAAVGRRTFADLPDNGDAAALFGDTLPLKATIAMRLGEDPGKAQWIPIPNPMATDTSTKTADTVTTHTLLNCLIREVSAPERQTIIAEGHLLLRLPRRAVLLRAALRRVSLIGAHRFSGPVELYDGGAWVPVGWRELAGYIQDELELRTGVGNEEFLPQVAESHETIRTVLDIRAGWTPPSDSYLESEQSLVFGHRFHPTPKARHGNARHWLAYGPETGSRFPLRYLAVRRELVREEGDLSALDTLVPVPGPDLWLLPVHPWQYWMLSDQQTLRDAIARGDVIDTGIAGRSFLPTASVRTLYEPDGDVFLKFSLNVRLTNCVRKNASYELSGAVALNHLVQPIFAELADRFPGCGMLAEPGYRSVDLDGDVPLLEGLGVIVRSGLRTHLRPGVTPLLAAAVADEYPTSTAQVSHLLARGDGNLLAWWDAYLGLLLPPVLAAYLEHGVVLEPHLQNVVVGVRADGMPAQVLFRDLEGTKLVPEYHREALAGLPEDVRVQLTYDAERGWNRVAYCLLVNHVSEMLGALADLDPVLEPALWGLVREHLDTYARSAGDPLRLRVLLSGVPLPAKANLLLRWSRQADRHAGYVPLPSPLGEDLLWEVTR
jgi:siderophore synthetase component